MGACMVYGPFQNFLFNSTLRMDYSSVGSQAKMLVRQEEWDMGQQKTLKKSCAELGGGNVLKSGSSQRWTLRRPSRSYS